MEENSLTAPVSTETSKRLSPRGLFRTARNLTLASIGIAGVLGDEAGALYRRSVERGGDTVQRVRDQLPRVYRPHPGSKSEGKRGRRSRQVSDGFETALARLNVATAADMDALAQQVAELGAKIDQLSP